MKIAQKYLSLFVLIAAIGLIAFGIMMGEPRAVFTKSATICLECIGVG